MATPINKKTLEHLAKLARVLIPEGDEEKLVNDLEKILAHFEELKSLPAGEATLAYGGEAKNEFREDGKSINTNHGRGVEALPETKDEYLKIPPVFE